MANYQCLSENRAEKLVKDTPVTIVGTYGTILTITRERCFGDGGRYAQYRIDNHACKVIRLTTNVRV